MSTWVLLRGLMREQRHWGRFPAQLQAALPQACVITLDMPGNGVHYAQTSATRVADMVESCRAQLRGQGEEGPYHLLALSLGAMVAVEWSARYPGEIAGAVLINTSLRPFSPFYRRLRWQNYAALLKLALLGGARRQERTILRLTSRRHGDDTALLQSWFDFQADAPVSRINALRQLLAAACYRAPAQRPNVPMIVLASEGDRLVDVRCSIALAHAWGIPIALHPNAGHDLPLDDGEWVIGQVVSADKSMLAELADSR
jgi:pimeloyl-ACP methyl ester carboxylesterase